MVSFSIGQAAAGGWMKLGEVLKKWRLMKEYDLRTTAKMMGIGAATLLRVEMGHSPGGKTLARILTWLMR